MTHSTPTQAVAAELRSELARRRIPRSALAPVLGLSQMSVSRRLSGATPIDVNELVKISEFLEVPVSYFMPKDGVA